MIESHFHWSFMAIDEGMVRPVKVTVIGYTNEESALIAIKDLVERDIYKLEHVWECYTCEYQAKVAQSMADLVKTGK